jgi:isoquinoline 1-oxidoreductase alpha subunit
MAVSSSDLLNLFTPSSLSPYHSITPKVSMPTLNINGKRFETDAEPDTPLLWVLRDYLGLTGSKYGCGKALCGACTVHIDGTPTRSCVLSIAAVSEATKITTIEAIGATKSGQAVQAAWVAEGVPQCGYCQSGQVMSAVALLNSNSQPTDADIDAAMSGNICRCATYVRIRTAIKRAAQTLV